MPAKSPGISEQYAHFHHVIEGGSGGLQNSPAIGQRLARLSLDGIARQLAGDGRNTASLAQPIEEPGGLVRAAISMHLEGLVADGLSILEPGVVVIFGEP
jgi:hypothetical protein